MEKAEKDSAFSIPEELPHVPTNSPSWVSVFLTSLRHAYYSSYVVLLWYYSSSVVFFHVSRLGLVLYEKTAHHLFGNPPGNSRFHRVATPRHV